MRKILISDFTIKEVPHGGSEWVNQVLIDRFNLEFEYSNQVKSFDYNALYIISNISLMNPNLVNQIQNLNYVIIENDYKICASRHPWRYTDNIIPIEERTNYSLYRNAKAVFVQTTDHMNVYLKNDVVANFINLNSSIWSNEDLELLRNLNKSNNVKNDKYSVYYTNNWIKNTQGSLKYCSENKLPVHILKESKDRVEFLSNMAKCKGIVFFPIARETFCRLVVEAKCLGLEVITTQNYGASLEEWFNRLSGDELIDFLETNTLKNLEIISTYI
jgi:hypothetical protein